MAPASLEPIAQAALIGVDLGQKVDPTAIVGCEVQLRDYTRHSGLGIKGGELHYVARHVERLPLNTSYEDVAARLVAIYDEMKPEYERLYMYVDATGVGAPVVDFLRRKGVQLTPVYLTGGDHETRENGEIKLPKTLLVSSLMVLFDSHRVHLPQTAEAQALTQELHDFEIRVNDKAHMETGAFRVGAHDDLVVALGLATRPLPAPDFSMTRVVGLYKGHDEREARERPLRRWQRRL